MIHRSAFAHLAILGLLAAVPATASASGKALLVGASSPAEGPALPGAEVDVQAMQQLLTETYQYAADDVTTLVGAAATVQAVTDALTALGDGAPKDEPVVIYFAGAGVLVSDDNQDEPDPWDEAWGLADGLLLDDALHEPLGRLLRRASHVALIVDASAEPAQGETRRHTARFAGRRTPPRSSVEDASLGLGDGAAHWADTGPANLVVVDAARLGAALETKRGGELTRALVDQAPKRATYAELADRVITQVAARSPQVPSFVGELDGPLFGKEGIGEEVVPVTKFEIPDGGITVTVLEGDRPIDVPPKQARLLRKEISRDKEIARRVTLIAPDDGGGDWTVRRDPTAGSLEIVGPEGGVRNRVDDDDLRSAADKVAENLMLHGQQAALLDMDIEDGPLTVRMVPVEEQSTCAHGEWVQAGQHEVQIVPVCWRWQVEVKLLGSAGARAEVGVIVMGNDGTLLGFPMQSDPVVLEPGETHRFTLQRPKRPVGLQSVPPLDITEHVLAFAAPAGANVDFDAVSGWAARDVSEAGAPPVEGRWFRAHLPYRVTAVPPRPGDLPRDPAARRRDITLAGFDVTPYMPANPNAYLTKVLQQADRLAKFRPTRDGQSRDGLAYAQCWDDGSQAINGRTRFSERDWPGETCWERPFDFTRDDLELGDSPGIDCSSTMWFVYTRACKGDTRLPVPEKGERERNAEYAARLRAFHEDDRKCLLFTDENFRAGFVSTNIMANHPEIMKHHFHDCMGTALQTGDILVTRNQRNSGGHTYLVVDPDRFVIFGSHAGDASWARMSPEERALWEEYEKLDPGARDTGVEYQFLAWYRKSDLVGTELEKWGGYATERLKACWRHKKVAEEWASDPTSRPGTRRDTRMCNPETCR